MYARFGKRLLDLVLGSCLLILGAPLLFLTSLIVLVSMGRPLLFRQLRSGFNGKRFTPLKFRTMTDERGPDGMFLPDRSRVTGVGRLLRSLSLDELPQLWNVMRGEMSLVGPRPLSPAYDDRYSPSQRKRLLARPGLTGLAQVSGRNAISWEEKLSRDVEYVENRSLLLDFRILLKTVIIVLRREGVNANPDTPMPEFLGSRAEEH